MIDLGHALPLAAQARQLVTSRGSIYYLPRAVSETDLAIMRRIDELHLLYPFAGSRMLRDMLRQERMNTGCGRCIRSSRIAARTNLPGAGPYFPRSGRRSKRPRNAHSARRTPPHLVGRNAGLDRSRN